MSTQLIQLQISERQLATIISGLLFSCSVNIVSETNKEYQKELYAMAKTLKEKKPDIKLEQIQYVDEENYKDEFSEEIKKDFDGNIEVVEFSKV